MDIIMAQLLVKQNGWRDRSFRPYIEQEETDIFAPVWDPYRSTNEGLYEPGGPKFHMFKADVQHYDAYLPNKYPANPPIGNTGGKYLFLGQL
jgi:hypothetical protein